MLEDAKRPWWWTSGISRFALQTHSPNRINYISKVVAHHWKEAYRSIVKTAFRKWFHFESTPGIQSSLKSKISYVAMRAGKQDFCSICALLTHHLPKVDTIRVIKRSGNITRYCISHFLFVDWVTRVVFYWGRGGGHESREKGSCKSECTWFFWNTREFHYSKGLIQHS